MERAWRICGECGHVYRDAEALADAHNELVDQSGGPVVYMPYATAGTANTLSTCPLCLHDF